MAYFSQMRIFFIGLLVIEIGSLINPMIIGALSSQKYSAVVYQERGGRDKQEDFFLNRLLDRKGFFGVFDGHTGDQAACFTQLKLLSMLVQKLKEGKAIKTALTNTFIGLDSYFSTCYPYDKSGAAVVTAFISDLHNKIYLAHTGDCRALVVGHTGELLAETVDHKPNIPSERERIEFSGATVTEKYYADGSCVSRVCLPGCRSGLSMSRSIGDHSYKRYGCVARPDIIEASLKHAKFIVLASDGLWQVMESEEVGCFIKDYLGLFKEPPSIEEMREIVSSLGAKVTSLWQEKYPGGSMDNTTIMFVLIEHDEDEVLCDPRSLGDFSSAVSVTHLGQAKDGWQGDNTILGYAEELEVESR